MSFTSPESAQELHRYDLAGLPQLPRTLYSPTYRNRISEVRELQTCPHARIELASYIKASSCCGLDRLALHGCPLGAARGPSEVLGKNVSRPVSEPTATHLRLFKAAGNT
jgi:hypothetical protein